MLKPLGNRVLLELVEEEETTESGLVFTGTSNEKPDTAKVVAVGSGKRLEDGSELEVSVKEGDVVLYEKYAGTEIEHEGVEYLVVKEDDIVAVVE